ncbi:MAG: glycogen synthase GlgA [Clostridia bacterium]|nr:glycogen synthase GlgA [Clostridia bacterium]
MKILFAASECMPFVKTGGLADVIGALPQEIVKTGADIRVILPLYRAISREVRENLEHVTYFYINLGWRRQYVGIEKLVQNGVTFYFIDNEQYFGRDYIYGKGGDEGERFAYFCKAVLESLTKIDFIPDVLHCHDWQTGLIPVLLKAQYQSLAMYKNIKTVFTIHNLQFQGIYPIADTEELLSLGDWAYTSDNLEFYGSASFIKGGLVFADRITTVSPTYAEEILSPYYGERLDGLLRSRAPFLSGILNGIDTIEYNPENDPLIEVGYTADTFEKKLENKLALQKELGLTVDASAPVIGLVTRLSSQKGLDLVERVLDGIMATGAQIVVLGMGESKYVDLFGWAQWKYAGRLAACFQMNHRLAHRIYAGADMFLMPSMFEPCGLSQLISLRYGTLPIVRETGGLRDTVLAYNEFTGEGNGFSFFNYNAHDMLYVIEQAVKMYKEKNDIFQKLAKRAMLGEYGWDQSALKYVELYKDILPSADVKAEAEAEEVPAEEVKAEEKPKRKPRAKKAEAAEEGEVKAEEKPKRKPRAKKAEAAAEGEVKAEEKPKRKPRAKKAESEKAE